jgi:hypothetical protein
MNRPQTKPTQAAATEPTYWSLEVVRGRTIAHQFALGAGEIVVGNDLGGMHGLDLADQEGSSPRKMAARHAVIVSTNQDLTVRDLDSPGGTFVNQQRLLTGQSRRLVVGDVIQLGGVQLRVKHNGVVAGDNMLAGGAAPVPASNEPRAHPSSGATTAIPAAAPPQSPSPVRSGRLSTPFAMAGGAQCRTWDDFLVAAAQSWPALRDELTSGRLTEYLLRIHRAELVPRATPGRSADDQLDDWLARLPSAGSSEPELDVHPETVLVRAATGGGVTRQALRITNVGYRLLRSTVRVEPAGTRWLRLRPEHDGRSFATIDQTDLPIELELPETVDRPLEAFVVIESNGGTRRVAVRIERPIEQQVLAETGGLGLSSEPVWRELLDRMLAGLRPGVRVALACAGAVALRFIAVLVNVVPVGRAPGGLIEPRLSAFAIVLVALGVVAGLRLAIQLGEKRDLAPAALAGGALGLLASAFWFAMLQSVERLLGPWSNSLWVVAVLWGSIGALLGLVSILVVPYRSHQPEVAR